jgi:hypothetical protein
MASSQETLGSIVDSVSYTSDSTGRAKSRYNTSFLGIPGTRTDYGRLRNL